MYLHDRNTGSCGTVRESRKFMPKFGKLKKGEYKRSVSAPLVTVKWHDKRDVTLLSTFHNGEMVDSEKKDRITQEVTKKPDIVLDYNLNMRLIDKSDMQTGSVECVRKTIKWYKKIFFHLVDVSLLNAYDIYLTKTGATERLLS